MSLYASAILLACYLLGAIPFGLLIARLYGVHDIRSAGSGNIGATNVWRLAGPKAAGWVFLLDIGKGSAAVMAASLVSPDFLPFEIWRMLCGLSAVLGHILPLYLRFKGGKGVNTALGVLLVIRPIETAIVILLFGIVLSLTRYVSLGSIIAACSLPLTMIVEQNWLDIEVPTAYLVLAWIIALAVVITHRHNIKRLFSGTENRFGKKRESRNEKEDA